MRSAALCRSAMLLQWVSPRVAPPRITIASALGMTDIALGRLDGDDWVEGNGGDDVVFGNLGQDDLPVRAARRVLPPGALVGVSTHSLAQARAAQEAGVDYISIGRLTHSAPAMDFSLLIL